LLSDFYLNGQEALRQKEEQIRHYNWNCRAETIVAQADHIAAELRAQYPVVQSVIEKAWSCKPTASQKHCCN
jgi:hypothetical protein